MNAKNANKTKKDEIQRNHSTKFKPLLICKPSYWAYSQMKRGFTLSKSQKIECF